MDNDDLLDISTVFRKLKQFLALTTNKDSQAVIWALADSIQDRLDNIDMTEEQKGGILTGLFAQLIESNKQELALFRQVKNALQERKHATIH